MAVDINVVGPPGGMKGGGRRQVPRPPWHAAVSRTPLTTLCGLGFSFPRLQKAHLISPSSRTAPRPAAPAASAGKRRRGQVNRWGQMGTCFSRRTGHGAAIRLSFELNVSLVTEVTCSLQNPQALRKQTAWQLTGASLLLSLSPRCRQRRPASVLMPRLTFTSFV